MNLRSRRRSEPDTEILLSPLIDCVFLLLIFFLVTSVIKRYERQIPVSLADDTSAITAEGKDDAVPVGVGRDGSIYGASGKTDFGVAKFSLLADPDAHLKALLDSGGAKSPVIVVVERGTPFQKVINAQDRFEKLGFQSVRFRIRDVSLSGEEDLRDP
jgi:biopolymer transport protein ExbD